MIDIRKDFMRLNEDELDALGRAFNGLYKNGVIASYAKIHNDYFSNGIHWGPAFLPWHRDFLRKLEKHLQLQVPGVTLPYWDWTRSDSRDLNKEPWKSFFGGTSNTGGKVGAWDYTRSATPSGSLPTSAEVDIELGKTSFTSFRGIESGSHVKPHVWVGGTMAEWTSPKDPLFYLHHCNIDRLWATWQRKNANTVGWDYSSTGRIVGDRVEATRVAIDAHMVAVDETGATPRSVLKFLNIGYGYDDLAFGGNGGNAFSDDFANAESKISKIIVSHGTLVDNIAITYLLADGTRRSTSHGGAGGNRSEINFAPDEVITSVKVHGDRFINQITIETNKNNSYGPYGLGQGGEDCIFSASAKNPISGFSGRSGDYLDALGVLYRGKRDATL